MPRVVPLALALLLLVAGGAYAARTPSLDEVLGDDPVQQGSYRVAGTVRGVQAWPHEGGRLVAVDLEASPLARALVRMERPDPDVGEGTGWSCTSC